MPSLQGPTQPDPAGEPISAVLPIPGDVHRHGLRRRLLGRFRKFMKTQWVVDYRLGCPGVDSFRSGFRAAMHQAGEPCLSY